MSLPVLGILPDASGYNVTEGNTNISVQLDGGGPRVRADKLGAAHTVNCQWTVGPANYAYLQAFFRTATNYGSLPFQLNLIIGQNTPTLYTAQFMPGTFQLKSQIGQTYVVACQLWAIPNVETANDAAILAAGPVA